jgi:hypothetical protein
MGFMLRGEEALEKGHVRFVAQFTWAAIHWEQAKQVLDKYRDHADATGVDPITLQGYYVTSPGSTLPTKFVIIGLHAAQGENARFGLEMFCSRLIFGKPINASFHHTTEGKELKKVYT